MTLDSFDESLSAKMQLKKRNLDAIEIGFLVSTCPGGGGWSPDSSARGAAGPTCSVRAPRTSWSTPSLGWRALYKHRSIGSLLSA